MKDGSIDNITGEKFGWWVIWRKPYKTRYLIINIINTHITYTYIFLKRIVLNEYIKT